MAGEGGAPSKEEVLAWLRAAMASEFGFDESDLQPSTDLIMDLDLDSIDFVDLTASAEETFDFDLPEEDLSSIRTLQDAVDVMHAAIARARG